MLAFVRRSLLEVFLLGVSLVSYYLVRGSVVERVDEAMARAEAIVRLEERLGFFWELDLQAWVLPATL